MWLPRIGNRSATCIMMYALDRQVFPVYTHVWPICRRLGLTPPVAKPTPTQESALEMHVLLDIRYTLHVNLLSHGRETCTTYWPKSSMCVLAELCSSTDKPDDV